MSGFIRGANHALLVGEVLGTLARRLKVEPVVDKDNNYTNRIRVTRPSGNYLVIVVPEEVTED